jgi:hypothetical protein
VLVLRGPITRPDFERSHDIAPTYTSLWGFFEPAVADMCSFMLISHDCWDICIVEEHTCSCLGI